MLRLPRSRLLLGLGPERLEWVKFSRWPTARLQAHGAVSILTDRTSPSAYRPLLDQFGELCRSADFQGAEITAILSGGLVRYLCLPKHKDIGKAEELKVLARHRFLQIYGEAAKGWQISLSVGQAGESVASAVDTALVSGLQTTAAENGLYLASLQPGLMALFNAHHRDFARGKSGWLVLCDHGFMTYARIEKGQWQNVSVKRGASLAELTRWLDRENLTSLAPSHDIWLAGLALPAPAASPFRFHALNPRAHDGLAPDQYQLALCGGD